MPFANSYEQLKQPGALPRGQGQHRVSSGSSSEPLPPPLPSHTASRQRIPHESVSFFASINGCRNMSRGLPQPIVARNSGLIAAWNIWSRLQESTADSGLSARLIATPRRSFNQNLATLLRYAGNDPIWQLNHQERPTSVEDDEATMVLPTAALTFWSRQHALIECTDALERLLVHSDIGDELPAALFRPPAALFIRFGESFRDATPLPSHSIGEPLHLQGVYVFHAAREMNRVVSMVPVFEAGSAGIFYANTIEIVINDETRGLNTEIRAIGRPDQHGHFLGIAQSVAKVLFYMEQIQAVRVEDHCYSSAIGRMSGRSAKRAARLARHTQDLYDKIVLGPQEIQGHDRGERSTHLRRGHFRMQPYGPQASLRKIIFLPPMWIRSDRLTAPTANAE